MLWRVNNMCDQYNMARGGNMETANKFAAGMIALLSVTAVVLAVITMSVCFSIKATVEASAGKNDDAVAAAATDKTEQISDADAKKALYKVVSDNGLIAVKDADGKTLSVLKTQVRFLSEFDRERLKNGIEVFSDEELEAIVQDYEN